MQIDQIKLLIDSQAMHNNNPDKSNSEGATSQLTDENTRIPLSTPDPRPQSQIESGFWPWRT